MNTSKNFLNTIAQRFGLSLLSEWRLQHLHAAQHLRELFRLRDVDLVLDVGANEGQFRDFLRLHVGYEGWIASYEPGPDAFEALELRARTDDRWRVFPRALGSSPGTATFNVSGHSTLSSFRKPDFSASTHAAANRRTVREIDVEVDTVDRQLPALQSDLGVVHPYLKMDTQGFDLEVVRGAADSLASLVGLQFEGSVVPLYQDMPPFTEMLGHLNERGFVLSDMFAVTKDRALRLIEFDCVMVRH